MAEEVISGIEKSRKLADYYYDNFRKYYENKNYSKASEFLWKSVSALTHAKKNRKPACETCLSY